jgi:hypothetical protein
LSSLVFLSKELERLYYKDGVEVQLSPCIVFNKRLPPQQVAVGYTIHDESLSASRKDWVLARPSEELTCVSPGWPVVGPSQRKDIKTYIVKASEIASATVNRFEKQNPFLSPLLSPQEGLSFEDRRKGMRLPRDTMNSLFPKVF